MSWSEDDLAQVAGSEELEITSYRDDGSLRRLTPIWVVRVGDDLYIRSAYGSQGGWFRRATSRGVARVRAGGVETDVTLEPVADEAVREQVGEAYRSKYAGQPGALRPMLDDPAAGSTTRLVRE
ncbi:DUF2255 family protein [Actinomycetospora aeridis]|uniref:DUF2255 family protein n=1 Tax=Actinomycetospora aeridis TaxID=3129231 RepID=A0ABU8NF78_9PSEU